MRLLALLFLAAAPAFAHPVAQGLMDITVTPERVRIVANVSMEEVIVSNTLGSKDVPKDMAEAIQRHGVYLLNHIVLSADGKSLQGRVVSGREAPESKGDRALYEFEFDCPQSAAKPPASITIVQNILNDIEYSPGNPWEASYVLRIGLKEGAKLEGLLGSRQSIAYGCNWPVSAASIDKPTSAPAESEAPPSLPPLFVGAIFFLVLLAVIAYRIKSS